MILNLKGKVSVAKELIELLGFQKKNEQGGTVYHTSDIGWAIAQSANQAARLSKKYPNVYFEGGGELPVELDEMVFAFLDTEPKELVDEYIHLYGETGDEFYEIDSNKVLQEVVDLMGILPNSRQLVIEGDLKHILLPGQTREYKPIKGWGKVDPVIDLKVIAPLCRYPYGNHKTGCHFCHGKVFYYDVIDPEQEVWALYFSMNLDPLWSRLRKKFPHWSERQVQNHRYWSGTKKKLLKEFEYEFLETHPGPWCRALNRAPGHVNYTFGIWYNKTMEQLGIDLKWPPEPYPLTVQFLGRPKDYDSLHPKFILE